MASNVFNTVRVQKPSSNTFDHTHDHKLTTKHGILTPIMIQDCLPGDVFDTRSEVLIRYAPLIAPIMHDVQVSVHTFFIPNRILWDNWQDFISPDLANDTPPAWPHFDLGAGTYSFDISSLGDYLGLPTGVPKLKFSALPMAAYQCVYNEYYRDQNLIDEVDFKLNNGDNAGNLIRRDSFFALRRRAWQHDYFTSALPFAQKGPQVSIPLGEFNDVDVYLDSAAVAAGNQQLWTRASGTGFVANEAMRPTANTSGASANVGFSSGPATGVYNVNLQPNHTLKADTSSLDFQAASINNLRVAIRLQEFYEKAARGGSRYIEQIRMHFGTIVPDYRLDRPEFIGGTRNPVIISEVLQTSESQETPQANMAGHGISASGGSALKYRCLEHGYIMSIMSVMPRTAYQQGLPRHFSRSSWDDYAWPTFAHLGEQEILNKEIYFTDTDNLNDDEFGYIPRYSEYRYTPSRVSGEFRTTLNFWHMGRIFENRPLLNKDFIECNPTNRIFAVEDDSNQNLWCHVTNRNFVRRSLPKYGTPTL